MILDRIQHYLGIIFFTTLVLTQALIFVAVSASNDDNLLSAVFIEPISENINIGDSIYFQAMISDQADQQYDLVYFNLKNLVTGLDENYQASLATDGTWLAQSSWDTTYAYQPGQYYLSVVAHQNFDDLSANIYYSQNQIINLNGQFEAAATIIDTFLETFVGYVIYPSEGQNINPLETTSLTAEVHISAGFSDVIDTIEFILVGLADNSVSTESFNFIEAATNVGSGDQGVDIWESTIHLADIPYGQYIISVIATDGEVIVPLVFDSTGFTIGIDSASSTSSNEAVLSIEDVPVEELETDPDIIIVESEDVPVEELETNQDTTTAEPVYELSRNNFDNYPVIGDYLELDFTTTFSADRFNFLVLKEGSAEIAVEHFIDPIEDGTSWLSGVSAEENGFTNGTYILTASASLGNDIVANYGPFAFEWQITEDNVSEEEVRNYRKGLGLKPSYQLVDTCAGEFPAKTPYFYSSYESNTESVVSDKEKVLILGSGPNRIGQGIEFDYCCVHASLALREMGIESIMVNSNPETVSTDYDTSDRLYFEPLTREDVLNIVEQENPVGIIVQFGGQTPLNLSVPLSEAGVTILGTSPDSIDRAEDRERFQVMLKKLQILQPENGIATNKQQAIQIADRIGYPVVVRPSFVLGGRAMEIVYDRKDLEYYMETAVQVSPGKPVLVDRFLDGAVEIDVDAISDGHDTVIGGIMEHIEEAGIHSGDSACVLPPVSLGPEILDTIMEHTRALAKELSVVGLMNIQYAVRDGIIYVIEVNPRASRTVPFVSKATGVPLANMATRVIMGKTLKELGFIREVLPEYVSVKEAVFPFSRFPGVDTILGPEMKSTGEVMGIDRNFGLAFGKSQLAAGQRIPLLGTVFISVKDTDKAAALPVAMGLFNLGFKILATQGTSRFLMENGVTNESLNKVREGRPHVVDMIKNGEIHLVINTTSDKKAIAESYSIRRASLTRNVPYTTTLAGAKATLAAIRSMSEEDLKVRTIQEYHGD